MKSITINHSSFLSRLPHFFTGILILYCYYQGLHKYLSFVDYSFWLEHTPFIKSAPMLFAYGVPAYYSGIAVLLMFKKTRTPALWALIIGETAFVIWVLYMRTYTPWLFWPWHVFWNGALQWFYKFLEAISVAWMAFLVGYFDAHTVRKR